MAWLPAAVLPPRLNDRLSIDASLRILEAPKLPSREVVLAGIRSPGFCLEAAAGWVGFTLEGAGGIGETALSKAGTLSTRWVVSILRRVVEVSRREEVLIDLGELPAAPVLEGSSSGLDEGVLVTAAAARAASRPACGLEVSLSLAVMVDSEREALTGKIALSAGDRGSAPSSGVLPDSGPS